MRIREAAGQPGVAVPGDAPRPRRPGHRLLARIRRLLSTSVHRCPSEHYAAFLRRSVRCRLDARHREAHRFTTLDETVVWH